jgi:2-succinyl-5-enolpyruvyl-6-hydroxy-3-cyclohexene-1-carboxylate synthase
MDHILLLDQVRCGVLRVKKTLQPVVGANSDAWYAACSLAAAGGTRAEMHILQERDWPAVAPDVILQLGGHLTSKRLAQFLDWAALGGDGR